MVTKFQIKNILNFSTHRWRRRCDDIRFVSRNGNGPGVDVLPFSALTSEDNGAEAASGHLLTFGVEDEPNLGLKMPQFSAYFFNKILYCDCLQTKQSFIVTAMLIRLHI